MKRSLAALSLWTAFAVGGAAQQPANPGNTRADDAASIGNQKHPKREKAPTSRTVSGQVTDETGQVLQGAMVTLTDKKTNERTSFFTKQDGRYKFENLSFTTDYEVQARYKNFSSDARRLSQYDTAPLPVRILEVNTGAHPNAESTRKTAADPKY